VVPAGPVGRIALARETPEKVVKILHAHGLRKTSETSENAGKSHQRPPEDTDEADFCDSSRGQEKTSPFSAAGQDQDKEAPPNGDVGDEGDYWEVRI